MYIYIKFYVHMCFAIYWHILLIGAQSRAELASSESVLSCHTFSHAKGIFTCENRLYLEKLTLHDYKRKACPACSSLLLPYVTSLELPLLLRLEYEPNKTLEPTSNYLSHSTAFHNVFQ